MLLNTMMAATLLAGASDGSDPSFATTTTASVPCRVLWPPCRLPDPPPAESNKWAKYVRCWRYARRALKRVQGARVDIEEMLLGDREGGCEMRLRDTRMDRVGRPR